ncbi:MAG: phosphoglycerate kinase [Bacilli bacterium]|nr:phosphoglycerate kinase [Bacilli bacterium]
MNKQTIKDVNFSGKTVIVRVDFNVPLSGGQVSDDNRIVAALPTIKELQTQGAKIVLLSHLGKVNHKDPAKTPSDMKKNDMAFVAPTVKKYLKGDFVYCPFTQGAEVEKAIKGLKPQQVLLLQNTRYEVGEEKNDPKLAAYWANLADGFVMDAFGSAHRAHASTYGIPEVMNKAKKPTAIGFLVEKEVAALSRCVEAKEHPYVAILGGVKVSDKIKVIDSLLKKVDKILIGGAMAYTFLAAKGINVGNSLVEKDQLDYAKKCLKDGVDKIVLPIDHVIAATMDNPTDVRNTLSVNITDGFIGFDIGARTIELFKNAMKGAKIIFWNGPMGVFENEWFNKGTKGVCEAMANVKGAFTVVGGGDSASAVAMFGFKDKISHVSTGGGASLEMIENDGHLPGIDIVADKK